MSITKDQMSAIKEQSTNYNKYSSSTFGGQKSDVKIIYLDKARPYMMDDKNNSFSVNILEILTNFLIIFIS